MNLLDIELHYKAMWQRIDWIYRWKFWKVLEYKTRSKKNSKNWILKNLKNLIFSELKYPEEAYQDLLTGESIQIEIGEWLAKIARFYFCFK